MAVPLGRQPTIAQRYIDETTGDPLSLGYVEFFEVGSSTPLAVYADSDGNTSLGSSVDLDANGIAPSVFLAQEGYKVAVYSAADVLQTAQSGDQVEDVGSTFLGTLGNYFGAGRTITATGSTLLPTDSFVVFNISTGTPIFNLEPVADRTMPVWFMNIGTVDVDLSPDGSDKVNFVASPFTLPSGTTPNWPVLQLLPRQADVSYVVAGGAYLT